MNSKVRILASEVNPLLKSSENYLPKKLWQNHFTDNTYYA